MGPGIIKGRMQNKIKTESGWHSDVYKNTSGT
jgi:hypothetical protein